MINRRTFVQSLAALTSLPILPSATLAASELSLLGERGYEGPLRLVTRTDRNPIQWGFDAQGEEIHLSWTVGDNNSSTHRMPFPGLSTEQVLSKLFRDHLPLQFVVTRMPTSPREWSWEDRCSGQTHSQGGLDHVLTYRWFAFRRDTKVSEYTAVWSHEFDLFGLNDDQIGCVRRVFSTVLRPYV